MSDCSVFALFSPERNSKTVTKYVKHGQVWIGDTESILTMRGTKMGYDLHIVRTRDWLDRDQHPILKSEVDALVAVDPELAWSETDYAEVRNPDTGEVVRSYGLFCKWRGGEAVFWCYGGEITLKNPTVTEQIKMVKMADALKAMVVGDDGERYSIRKNFFGKERLVVET